MPLYEYQCTACDHRLEALQKMTDQPLDRCPNCHQMRLKKLISAAAFRLKGTGWYETDFKQNGKKPEQKNPTGDADSNEKTTSTSSVKTDKKADSATPASTA